MFESCRDSYETVAIHPAVQQREIRARTRASSARLEDCQGCRCLYSETTMDGAKHGEFVDEPIGNETTRVDYLGHVLAADDHIEG